MKRLSIIVPYRDREEHLRKFAPHMNIFLKNKVIFKISIIEQYNKKSFNRGCLKNIGFDLTKEESDYSCFHDIDHIPVADSADYSYLENVAKLASRVSQFNFAKRPKNELAGVILFNNDKFVEVNGFSNEYWGWGVEDNDLGVRCERKGIEIEERQGLYLSLSHKTEGDTYHRGTESEQTKKNRNIFREVSKDDAILFSSGLSDLQYKVLDKQENDLYTLYKVDF
jgi:hypothetical protein